LCTPHIRPGHDVSWKGVFAGTELGSLRAERDRAGRHQRRLEGEWDRTLALIKDLDFDEVAPGRGLEGLRSATEIWHDLTLDPVRSISTQVQGAGLPDDRDERYDYLHRVFIGYRPEEYSTMCDQLEEGIEEVYASAAPIARPDLRDRVVELMELGVRSSTRSVEWLDGRIKELEDRG
jgi:hypothetical protein